MDLRSIVLTDTVGHFSLLNLQADDGARVTLPPEPTDPRIQWDIPVPDFINFALPPLKNDESDK